MGRRRKEGETCTSFSHFFFHPPPPCAMCKPPSSPALQLLSSPLIALAWSSVRTCSPYHEEAKQAAKRDAAAAHGGLDSVLLQMEKARKLNVLDKSKMDWKEVKEGDADMEEDLEKHKKGKTYLEQQDFLKRAELREYEIERDARLAGDVRSRGRL